METETIAVIGGGFVGVSIALELQRRGANVRLLERKGIAAEASAGNAGAFAFSDVIPLATPGAILRAPGWLLNPNGPLYIPPAYATNILLWLVRFLRASRPDRYVASLEAQSRLMAFSRTALERQVATVDGERFLRREGQLQLYQGARGFPKSLASWRDCRDQGITYDLLRNRNEIAEIQPGLNPCFTHGAYTPDWINTTDPAAWTMHLADCFKARGGVIETLVVDDIRAEGAGVALKTDQGEVRAAHAVVAAGAWSHRLTNMLGDPIPLETERGYNTTLPHGAAYLRTHLTFPNHGFVVSKIGDGVRVGGAVELGGLTLPPRFGRADTLLRKACRFLPALGPTGGRKWTGFRPSLPDNLPVIGRSRNHRNVVYAFGHGHLGLTQAAGTAELVADLLWVKSPALPLSPFSADRF